MPKHFLNNSNTTLKLSIKRICRPAKLLKFAPENRQNEQILDRKLRFFGPFTTFGAENTAKSRPCNADINAQTLPKQLQNNLEKLQKTSFSTANMTKTRPSTSQKVPILRPFSIYELYFWLVGTEKR